MSGLVVRSPLYLEVWLRSLREDGALLPSGRQLAATIGRPSTSYECHCRDRGQQSENQCHIAQGCVSIDLREQ